jgi:hypothetical protein
MLDPQRDVAAPFRLAAIAVLLPQPREIRCRLRPRGDGYRCEQQKAQTISHAAMHRPLALFHSQSTLNPQDGHAGRPADLLAVSEFKPQRELYLARRSRTHWRYGRYDGGVQVYRVGNLAERRP